MDDPEMSEKYCRTIPEILGSVPKIVGGCVTSRINRSPSGIGSAMCVYVCVIDNKAYSLLLQLNLLI